MSDDGGGTGGGGDGGGDGDGDGGGGMTGGGEGGRREVTENERRSLSGHERDGRDGRDGGDGDDVSGSDGRGRGAHQYSRGQENGEEGGSVAVTRRFERSKYFEHGHSSPHEHSSSDATQQSHSQHSQHSEHSASHDLFVGQRIFSEGPNQPFNTDIDDCWILKTGSDADTAAVVDLTFDDNGSLVEATHEMRDLARYAPDAEMQRIVDEAESLIRDMEDGESYTI